MPHVRDCNAAVRSATPGVEHRKEFIPSKSGVTIEKFVPFADHAVVVERAEGLVAFRVTDYQNQNSKRVELPKHAVNMTWRF